MAFNSTLGDSDGGLAQRGGLLALAHGQLVSNRLSPNP